MKLRICHLGFKRDTKIQIDDAVKTKRSGDDLVLLELGNTLSYDRDHWVGIPSSQLDNVALIRTNIGKLESSDFDERLKWFKANFPKANIIKIESAKLADKLRGGKDNMDPSVTVVIDSAIDLAWKE